MNVLQQIGPAAAKQMEQQIAAGISTTFASSYARVVSLAGALQPEAIAEYSKHATGGKYLIDPSKAL